MQTRDGERIKWFKDGVVRTDTKDFYYTYTQTDRFINIKTRPWKSPGRFWARSSAGVYMNAHRRRMNGY